MANLPTVTAEPGLLDLTNTPTLPWWKDQGLRKLIFWQTCILAAQITVSYDEVIVGSFQALQPWQDAMGNPSTENLGLITCTVFIGGFFGALLAAAPADRYGRRFALQIGSFLGVVGSIINWSWRIPSIVQTAFPFLLMIATIFIPESPRWLCSRGRQIEAKDFMIKYHANGNESDPVIELEMHEIATALNLEEQSKMYTWSNLLKSKANRRRLEILPYSIRSKGLALQVLSSQVMLTVKQYVNPIALDRIGYYCFIFYLGMLFLGLALIYFTFPETKGYSLEELGMLFDDGFDVRPSILHGKDVENTSHVAQDDARKDIVKIIAS
ncbi:Lactose permease [Colletotrichum sp. SAR11_59]|nr:Lactose permease [Colletotrichum sp. SAR11_59]